MKKQFKDESIGRWISILHRNAYIYFNDQFKQYGLNGGAHIRPLMHVYKHPGVHQEDLASHFQKDKATVARSIKKLEELGWVYREKDPQDKRAYNLYPTSKAQDEYEAIKGIFKSWSDLLTEGFTQEERTQALELLKRMAENIDYDKHDFCKGECHESTQ